MNEEHSFDQHRLAQLKRFKACTPAERLAWLEQAKQFAATALREAAKRRNKHPLKPV